MDTILIGYSVNMLNNDNEWTIERRSEFLINPHIKLPKSVDSGVWEESHHFFNKISQQEKMDNITKWHDKHRLIDLEKYNVTDENRVLLSSYLHYFDYVPVEVWAMEYISQPIDQSLFFLGFDIANGGALSGLSNCGYTKSELEYCQENYLKHINQHGLFEDFDIAYDFLHYTNTRVSEEAPFYIYSLYTDKLI